MGGVLGRMSGDEPRRGLTLAGGCTTTLHRYRLQPSFGHPCTKRRILFFGVWRLFANTYQAPSRQNQQRPARILPGAEVAAQATIDCAQIELLPKLSLHQNNFQFTKRTFRLQTYFSVRKQFTSMQ
jgi:hypothetical protein